MRHVRHISKALSFEILSTIMCLVIAYFFFGHLNTCIAFAGVSFVFKLILYFYHDKVWDMFPHALVIQPKDTNDLVIELPQITQITHDPWDF